MLACRSSPACDLEIKWQPEAVVETNSMLARQQYFAQVPKVDVGMSVHAISVSAAYNEPAMCKAFVFPEC